MNKKPVFFLMVLLTLSLIMQSCGGSGSTITPPEADTNTITEPPAQVKQESPVTQGEVNLINENGDLVLDGDKITLLVYQGEARLSTDEGDSWSEIASGQWLEAGDEVQLSEDGLALIVLPQLGVIRLEGNAEYLIDEFTYDAATGDILYASQLFEGGVIFEINPLKTPNSRFSLGLITGIIQVRYDPNWKYQSDAGELIDLKNSVIASGIITREGEAITSFRGPVEIYDLGLNEELYFAVQFPTFENLAKSVTLEIPTPADLNVESDIEEFLPIADYLLYKYASDETSVYEGYQIVGEEGLEDGGKLIFFYVSDETSAYEGYQVVGEEGLEDGGKLIFFNGERENIEILARSYSRSVVKKPELQFNSGLIGILADETNLGCDPFEGSGCALPEGCDQTSGENCELATGCNPVTAGNCLNPGDMSGAISLQNGQLVMRAADFSIMPMLGDEENEKPTCFFSDPNWVCEQRSCWVCVSPDPSMGPPPAGWEPCHPACCCEPGARASKP